MNPLEAKQNEHVTVAEATGTEGRPSSGQGASKTGVTKCWSCKGPVPAQDLFCPTCKAIQPPGAIDHFTRLGVRPSFDVDTDALERAYVDLQRLLHPDRFVAKGGKEKALSQQQAVSLNEAFETLKDPLKRARYLLELKGHELPDEEGTIDDPELLMESMELREALDGAETVAQAKEFEAQARGEVKAIEKALAAAFAQDGFDDAVKQMTRLKYFRKLAEEARLKRAKLAA